MPDYRDFDRLESITVIEGVLVNETPIRVGTGGEPPLGAAVDIAVYRVEDTPIIPGSSLKGVFRSHIESIATSLYQDRGIHDPWDHERIADEGKRGDFCDICGIFGNTELASHVRIYDAKPKDLDSVRSFIKTGIGIDRVFGAVKTGIGPFKEEFIIPGVEWDFRMDLINIDLFWKPREKDRRVTLLKSLFETLKTRGLSIGARKSIGAGLMKLKEAKYTVYALRDGVLEIVREGGI